MNKLREALRRLESQGVKQALVIAATVDYDVTPPALVSFDPKAPRPEIEEVTIEVMKCPACHGVFGVDATYLDQVDTTVICPMCVHPLQVKEA